MAIHGNSKKNQNEHHVYAIYDAEEEDVFKYGISDKPIGKDGQSRRTREQVEYLNRAVGWFRYYALLLFRGILGRPKALEIEQECIDAYEKKCGRTPRGNID